jgi:FkbM family methyltransferase
MTPASSPAGDPVAGASHDAAPARASGAGLAGAARLRLPNGMTVIPQSRVEAEHFYQDIFEKRIYLRHGVTLRPGDCVFDVGGNIGTFSLFAARAAPGARIYAFEPAPPLFDRLRANLALNGVQAHAFDHGIADAERTARFTFYPNSPGMSSFHADAEEEREVLRRMMDREREEGVEGMDALLEFADELLDERFRAVELECRLRPLSAVIREEGVERIDLLKVDVQKAELDVLRGVADEDWPRIRQVVMEVHDLDGRLATIEAMLRERGFRVAVEQDEAVEGTILHNLFAVRPEDAREEGEPGPRAREWRLLLLSAPDAEALDAAAARLARHLAEHPALPLDDVAFTLGRAPALAHRRAFVVGAGEDAAARLAGRDPARTADGVAAHPAPSPVFLFPGVGEQYPGMARGLYGAEPVFRAEVDRCAEILRPHLGMDLREALFAAGGGAPAARPAGGVDLRRMLGAAGARGEDGGVNRTELAQPAAFVVGYALARLWESWGVRPAALAGHSLGEYTAACVAGVFTLADALELVALRARAIQALAPGAMLAVSLSPESVEPFRGDAALAAVNAPELCVLAGTEAAVAAVEARLAGAGIAARRLAATHAFHTPLVEPVAGQVGALAARMRLSPPRIPLVSNLTGGWLSPGEAVDPAYWARHLVGTVRFDRGAATLLAEPGRVLVEMGPGGSLGAFVRQQAAALGVAAPPGVTSLPHPADDTPDAAAVLAAAGRLWTVGVEVDGGALFGAGRPVPLPGPAPSAAPPSAPASAPSPSPGAEEEDDSGSVAGSVVHIWRELLGVEVRAEDDFFLLGGDSLRAARLIARVRERFGVEMRLRTLFQTRTAAALARWIEEASAARPGA